MKRMKTGDKVSEARLRWLQDKWCWIRRCQAAGKEEEHRENSRMSLRREADESQMIHCGNQRAAERRKTGKVKESTSTNDLSFIFKANWLRYSHKTSQTITYYKGGGVCTYRQYPYMLTKKTAITATSIPLRLRAQAFRGSAALPLIRVQINSDITNQPIYPNPAHAQWPVKWASVPIRAGILSNENHKA